VIWIEVALRIAIGCAAFAILYVAWFVYEDEEKELQSRIEGWWLNWLNFDDVRVSMISRQAAVVSVVARKATEVLDGVFGPRLFAKDSVAAATCFSVAGYVVIIFLSKYLEGRSDAVTWAFALAAIGLFICGVAPLVSVQFRRLPRAVLRVSIIVGEFMLLVCLIQLLLYLLFRPPPLASISVFMENESKHSASYVLLVPFVMVGGFAIGIGGNLLTVVVARLALTRIAVTGREWPIVGGMLLAIAPFVIFGVWVFASWRSLGTESLVAAAVIIAMSASIISGSLSMLVIGISGVMLLHRVAWPTASRLLYTLPRYQIVQKQKGVKCSRCRPAWRRNEWLIWMAVDSKALWRRCLRRLCTRAIQQNDRFPPRLCENAC
jgi:hypothetical protein